MKYLLKLNLVSLLYAVMIFVPILIIGNFYRISRITGWDLSLVNILSVLTIILFFIFGTVLLVFITRNWFKKRKANFCSLVLWIPYFLLLSKINATFFPITSPGDSPNSTAGLFVIGALLVFPVYIFIITTFSQGEPNNS
ncbi:hypothetical protein SAMN05421736_1352 [Evansella caseinilytica]|uniref:Uncharacterized protein n=1 Tax=Evansella caseinilytica TaxID=1503961 RepID=A0A1H3V189_9BACI|nr:hypothetical protein [Evansella caseinilytica]SDZ68434.1 hypothetical protein SAMN05421736_1352 [Evansella caseinilytica]